MQRQGSVIVVKKEKLEECKRLHADAWPGVLKTITECNFRNYSIYLRQLPTGKYYLFSYFEYVGNDFETDCAKMATDPITRSGGTSASLTKLRSKIVPKENGGPKWKRSSIWTQPAHRFAA